MRKLLVLALLAAVSGTVFAMPSAARPRGVNGKIALNSDNNVTHQEQVYLVDPDGSDRQLLANDAETGQWSPDGTRLACCGGIVDPDTGDVGPPTFDQLLTLYPDRLLFCGVWSPDGARLACEGGFLDQDPQGVSQLQGIYTVRSSDGGGLQRVTSIPEPFGDDCPGDYSPNGKELVFTRASDSVLALFTVRLDGSGLRQITPSMALSFAPCGSWSPQGNEIVFSARVPASDRGTLWVVHSDGSGLRRIAVPGCGGVADLPDGSAQPGRDRLLRAELVAGRHEDPLRPSEGIRAERRLHRQRGRKRALPAHAHARRQRGRRILGHAPGHAVADP